MMSHWIRYAILSLIVLSCAFFSRPNLYRKGVESYQRNDFNQAIKYFENFYKKSPAGDSTLFYLYNCYNRTGNVAASIKILEELAKRKNPNEQIYINLFQYYREQRLYHKSNQLLMASPNVVLQKIDRIFPLTQKLCAELFTGATTSGRIDDPIAYAAKKGFLKQAPDGKFYINDTLRLDYLILLLDSFLPPVQLNPAYSIKNIKPNSYLYLPYSRLVSQGIMQLDENINPATYASLSQALMAINQLKEKGYIK
ncbi:MAG: tetratricopeptide repeat protein [bacterium]